MLCVTQLSGTIEEESGSPAKAGLPGSPRKWSVDEPTIRHGTKLYGTDRDRAARRWPREERDPTGHDTKQCVAKHRKRGGDKTVLRSEGVAIRRTGGSPVSALYVHRTLGYPTELQRT